MTGRPNLAAEQEMSDGLKTAQWRTRTDEVGVGRGSIQCNKS